MHCLLQKKKAMDAVNEALLKPTEYPAADKDYDHPMWWKGTEPEQIKHAEVKMHSEPHVFPPRNELRSHLDDDVKKEIAQEKEGKLAARSIQLTPEQDEFWQDSFEFYANTDYSEAKAVRMADRETVKKWPELANFRHWTDPGTPTT